MRVEATPPLREDEQRALAVALESCMPGPGDEAYGQPWRLAALREGAESGEEDVRYAFSPRSTRGATRA